MGKSNPVAIVQVGIQHTLERRSLDLKIAVLGADKPDVIEFMIDMSLSWYNQGLYGEKERLEVKIVDFKKGTVGEKHAKNFRSNGDSGDYSAPTRKVYK